jgi:hypothetical protein
MILPAVPVDFQSTALYGVARRFFRLQCGIVKIKQRQFSGAVLF